MLDQYRQAIDQHRQRIYSFARYSLRAAEDAEDVTQDVFIKLWQHWRKIDHSKLGAWLMRVTHNAVIDHVRKQRFSRDHVDQFADVELESEDRDASQEIDQEAFEKHIQKVIQQLDDPFRSIIILRDIQGQSYADIQETLNMNESQVKVYLHRGRRKLRENAELRNMYESMSGVAADKPQSAKHDHGKR